MNVRKVVWCCLTAASFAFWLGVVSGAWSSNSLAIIECKFVSQADDRNPPPPAGDQFDEGPVLARLPAAHLAPVRYIF